MGFITDDPDVRLEDCKWQIDERRIHIATRSWCYVAGLSRHDLDHAKYSKSGDSGHDLFNPVFRFFDSADGSR